MNTVDLAKILIEMSDASARVELAVATQQSLNGAPTVLASPSALTALGVDIKRWRESLLTLLPQDVKIGEVIK